MGAVGLHEITTAVDSPFEKRFYEFWLFVPVFLLSSSRKRFRKQILMAWDTHMKGKL